MGKGGGKKGYQWVLVPVKQSESFIKPWSKGKGKSKSKGKKKGGGEGRKRTDTHVDEDPPGSCRVYVIGFDFGTTDEQFEGHMKKAGPIHAVHWISKGAWVFVPAVKTAFRPKGKGKGRKG